MQERDARLTEVLTPVRTGLLGQFRILWKRASGQRRLLEIFWAIVIASVLHVEPEWFRLPAAWASHGLEIIQYLLSIAIVVAAEHGFLLLRDQALSVNHKPIEILTESRVAIPADLVRSFVSMPHQFKADRYPQLLKRLPKLLELPEGTKDAIYVFLTTLEVSEFADDVGKVRIFSTLNELNNLTRGNWFSSDIYTQYLLASGVAEKFKDNLDTMFATTLDSPSDFFHETGRIYFKQQIALRAKNGNRFFNLTDTDMTFLQARIESGMPKHYHHDVHGEIPPKIRIVVASIEDLLKEFADTKRVENFEKFNKWHLDAHFCLRYCLLDDYKSRSGNAIMYEGYLEDIKGDVNPESVGGTDVICDFVVYNENVVYGRLDRSVENVKIMMWTAPEKQIAVARYKTFFRYTLYPKSLPFWAMWARLEESAKVNEDLHGIIKKVAEDLAQHWTSISR
jgi:hypothetical protein